MTRLPGAHQEISCIIFESGDSTVYQSGRQLETRGTPRAILVSHFYISILVILGGGVVDQTRLAHSIYAHTTTLLSAGRSPGRRKPRQPAFLGGAERASVIAIKAQHWKAGSSHQSRSFLDSTTCPAICIPRALINGLSP